MNVYSSVALLTLFLVPHTVDAAPPPPLRSPTASRSSDTSTERWVEQLEGAIDHLQEDLYFERGSYPTGLQERADRASAAVAHYHEAMRRGDRQHVMRDFQEMDEEIHELVELLERSGDPWMRRQASRIRYPDEQLHFALRTGPNHREKVDTALIARHANLLEREAKSLLDVGDRVNRQDQRLHQAIEDFVQEVEHFHQVAEEDGDLDHLRRDFEDLDEAWHEVVQYINQSRYGFYFRRAAQDVNQVHNQIHTLVTQQSRPPVVATPVRPQPGTPRPEFPRDDLRRAEPTRERPAIQFTIPRIGSFSIPR